MEAGAPNCKLVMQSSYAHTPIGTYKDRNSWVAHIADTPCSVAMNPARSNEPMLFLRAFRGLPIISRRIYLPLFLASLLAGPVHAQKPGAAPAGIAWQVQGTWQMEGKGAPVRTGDAIPPASLLQPSDTAAAHSLTVLLPDGQRVLYECFTVADCARGFRVPPLIAAPGPFAVDMLARIRSALAGEHNDFSGGSEIQQSHRGSRDEAVAVLDASDHVNVTGLASTLPSGHYTYDLRPLDPAYPPQFHLVLEKTAPSITLSLPASGLYILTISDDLKTPRVDLFLAAVKPGQSAVVKSFSRARNLMAQWDADYYGWPKHDFLRAYLESFLPSTGPNRAR
jgi:hypothetical protein